jgi:hypothetical protein
LCLAADVHPAQQTVYQYFGVQFAPAQFHQQNDLTPKFELLFAGNARQTRPDLLVKYYISLPDFPRFPASNQFRIVFTAVY